MSCSTNLLNGSVFAIFVFLISEHPLSALSNGDISVVSSFNVGDTFSECVIGDSARYVMAQTRF